MTLRRFALYLLPLLCWMLIIFGWSTDVGSTEHTSFVIEQTFSIIPALRNLSTETVEGIDHIVRKGAHIFEYAVLALLAYRAIRQDRQDFRDMYVWGPILLAVVYASTDEYHQIYVATRGPSVGDVGFDTVGALIGTVINLWRFARENKRLKS